jgi:hypothetical protein
MVLVSRPFGGRSGKLQFLLDKPNEKINVLNVSKKGDQEGE